jgi:S-adenosylmethionine:tRNA ribosyltransferase-isomerase
MKAALTNNNNPVIAVGTTSLRTIESLYWLGVKAHRYEFVNKQVLPAHEMNLAQWEAYELNEYSLPMEDAMAALLIWLKHNQTTTLIAKTQLIVTPGYQFKICAGLITNFHQPKSTLLLIIAAIIFCSVDFSGVRPPSMPVIVLLNSCCARAVTLSGEALSGTF